ncbi:MAG: hypothetical protein AAFZ65_03840 [Planctomycetota bacterium]
MNDDSETPTEPAPALHSDLPANRTMEPSWRWRLLLVDGILALGLAWILYDLTAGRKAAEEAEAEERKPTAIEALESGG